MAAFQSILSEHDPDPDETSEWIEAAHGVLEHEGAAVFLYDLLDDGQPQPGPLLARGDVRLEEPRPVLGQADAVVLDGDARQRPLGRQHHADGRDITLLSSIFLIGFDGFPSILDEVRQRLRDHPGIDLGRHLNAILGYDAATRRVRVQPGVVRNELNRFLAPHGVLFGPETSTANRAMIGGMVGNNSCGSNSIVYGSVRDHLVSARGFLSDGSMATFGALTAAEFAAKCAGPDTLETRIYRFVRDLLGDYSRPAQRFPPEDFVDGFKNQLGAQGMPPLLVETYSTAAEKLALNAFRAGDINSLVPCKPASATDANCRDRFIREARATAAIEHDHIITIYEVCGNDTEVPYAAMQYLRGMSLDDWLRAGKTLNVPQIMRIGKEIAKGLAAAHACKLIHRDIKPSNIWLDASNKGRVKIALALAKGKQAHDKRETIRRREIDRETRAAVKARSR